MSKIHYGRGYVYSIQYHLVWCVKYRHDALIGQVDDDLKQLLIQIAKVFPLDSSPRNIPN